MCQQMEVGGTEEGEFLQDDLNFSDDLALLAARKGKKGSGWRGSFAARTAGL